MNSIPDQITSSVKPEVTGFFDEPTNTITYVVKDPASAACAVICNRWMIEREKFKLDPIHQMPGLNI
jgi:hypothetical protein